jgi:predicted HNH restriction endonuclease
MEVLLPETVMEAVAPNASDRHLVLNQLIASTDLANVYASNAWSVTLKPWGFRLNVGQVESLIVQRDMVRILLAGPISSELRSGNTIEDIFGRYQSITAEQFEFNGTFNEFANAQGRLAKSHQNWLRLASTTNSGQPRKGSPFKNSHSPELMHYAKQFVRSDHSDKAHAPVETDLVANLFEEGRLMQTEVWVRDRSIAIRDLCLLAYEPPHCVVCGYTPSEVFGPEFSNLLEVHHLTPLSASDLPRLTNPVEHCVPLCPNCHRLAHYGRPHGETREIDELWRLVCK